MIKVEHIEVFNWEGAIRGMRNPLNSWDKSDSGFDEVCEYSWIIEPVIIGENDLALMRKLIKAGSDHRKFLRQIMASMDITAPLYWWKEFDTYKVGTVANSCSTMHTIHKKPFELDDFSHERLICGYLAEDEECFIHGEIDEVYAPKDILLGVICSLNACREAFLNTKDKRYWYQMIQLLPSSYNQKRTVTLNYEVLLNMHHARRNHKLDEWRTFCGVIEDMPYFREICLTEEENNDL